ncbi:MAG: hypothetical protein KJZ53_00440, partial [Anaerolineales bacterium]|nr:hypothetical protein [Anaerolineales bacterium]
MPAASRLKDLLGHVPATAELAWALRGGDAPIDGFKLEELRAQLPGWVGAVQNSPLKAQAGRKALVFATLHYWINHASLLSLALRGMGHDVTLSYLPYATWKADVPRFDLRRRDAYARSVFAPMQAVVPVESFLNAPAATLPASLDAAVEQVSIMDVQYTQQVEEIDKSSQLFQLRLRSNRAAASAALAWLQREQPDVVILPNGLILEFGAVLQAARHLNIPVVSYEFGEQRGRIWLAHNASVMLQETDSLWAARRNAPFTDAQRAEAQELFATRQAAG